MVGRDLLPVTREEEQLEAGLVDQAVDDPDAVWPIARGEPRPIRPSAASSSASRSRAAATHRFRDAVSSIVIEAG